MGAFRIGPCLYVLADVRHADRVGLCIVKVGTHDDVLVVMDGVGDVKRLLVRLQINADVVSRCIDLLFAITCGFMALPIGNRNRHAFCVRLSSSLGLDIASRFGGF